MQIDKIGTPLTSQGNHKIEKNEETPIPIPLDTCTQSCKSSPSMMLSATSVFNTTGLNKNVANYCIASYTIAPDGTTYIAYRSLAPVDKKIEHRGYISAVSPSGEILWESPVDDEGLSSLAIGRDGTIFAITKEHLRALNSDGTLKFQHPIPQDTCSHFLDSAENHYFIKNYNKEISMMDREGNLVELPECLKGIRANELKHIGPDEIIVRDNFTFHAIDLKEKKEKWRFTYGDTLPKKDNCTSYVDHFDMDSNGKIKLWIVNSYYVPGPPIDEFHYGLGYGHPWRMPHFFPHDFISTQAIIELCLQQLDSTGKTEWKIDYLGSSPISTTLPDGSVIFTNNKEEYIPNPEYSKIPTGEHPTRYIPREIGSGRYFIGRVSPTGKKNEDFIKVEGRINTMMVNPESGKLIVSHGANTISEFNSGGELVRMRQIPQDKLHLKGLAGSDTVILRDSNNTSFFAFDMESAALTPLTAKEQDFSFKVKSREIEKEKEEGKEEMASMIEEFDDCINIQGVKIPKKAL